MAVTFVLLLQLLNIVAAAAPSPLHLRSKQRGESQLQPMVAALPAYGQPVHHAADNRALPSAAADAPRNGAEITPSVARLSIATLAPRDHSSSAYDELLSDDVLFGNVKPWTAEDFADFLTFTSQNDDATSNLIGDPGDAEAPDHRRPLVTPTTSTELPLEPNDDAQVLVEMTTTSNNVGAYKIFEEATSTVADLTHIVDAVTAPPNSSVSVDEQKPSMLALRVRDPDKILDIIQLFERYSSLRNTTLLPSIRRKTTEILKYSPSAVRNALDDLNSNFSSPKVTYAGVGITVSDFDTNLPPLRASPRPTSSVGSSSILQAFTNFLDDVGQAVGDFLSSVGNAYANNPVLTVLTLVALGFLLFHLIANYAWLKKPPQKGHGHGGYHKRMDIGDTFYDDALKLQRILDVIDDYERKYGEKIFV